MGDRLIVQDTDNVLIRQDDREVTVNEQPQTSSGVRQPQDMALIDRGGHQTYLQPTTGRSTFIAEAPSTTFVTDTTEPRDSTDAATAGVTYLQESTPMLAVEHETWFNPTTHSWRVYHDGAWQPLYSDGGYF